MREIEIIAEYLKKETNLEVKALSTEEVLQVIDCDKDYLAFLLVKNGCIEGSRLKGNNWKCSLGDFHLKEKLAEYLEEFWRGVE